MPITIGGIASGLDTNGIIDQLVELERRPITLLQQRITRQTARLTAVTALGGNAAAVGAGVSRVTLSLFTKSNITSSDATVLTATDEGDAQQGSYSVEVKQLAKAHRVASDGFIDKDSTAVAGAAGTFSWKIGPSGATQSVSVGSTTTLQDLADAINAEGGGISASIINDATAANPNRLVLTSTSTGTAQDITVLTNDTDLDFANKQIDTAEVGAANSGTYTGTTTSSGAYTGSGNKTFLMEIISAGDAGVATYKFSTDGGLTFDDNGGAGYTADTAATAIGGNAEGVNVAFTDDGSSMSVGDRFSVDVFDPELQSSQDAITVVDGITAVTQSNEIENIISGVKLNLVKVDIGNPVTVTVAADSETLVSELNGIAVGLNNFAKFVNAMNAYDPETQTAGILSGDAAVRGMHRVLRSQLVATQPNSGNAKYDSLLALGFKSDQEGNVSFDQDKFLAALADDKDAVLKLVKDYGATSTSKIQYKSQGGKTQAGVYQVEIVDDGAGGNAVTVGGIAMTLEDDTLTGATGTALEGLTIEIKDLQSQAQGNLGTVTVTKGLIDNLGRAVDAMVDPNSGIIQGKKTAIDTQIESLNEQIARQERRITKVEQRIRRRFTDLEIIMGRMQSQQDFITQQIAQFNKDR